jgi:hypothetical protein
MDFMRNISNVIIQFSIFLNASWAHVSPFFNDSKEINENISNWLQANWEILVESAVCKSGEFLDLYGDGADFDESESSRVTYKSISATHYVGVNKKKDVIFDYHTKKSIENLDTYHTLVQK